jgi:hypothetical protein
MRIIDNILRFKIFIIVLLFSFISGSVFTQTQVQKEKILQQTKVEKLQDRAVLYKKQSLKEKKEAIKLARRNGWIIRKEFDNGRIMELQRVENGQPIYYITYNLDAAKTISTNEVWSGGDAGLNLSGAALAAGVWDGGAVRTSHQEFEGRVNQADGASGYADHATHVTGTVCAVGVENAAKGMAYQANVDAYDWNSDLSEMSNAASDGLLVSNHSYGIPAGYSWNGTSYDWYGNTSISTEEDYKFGFYNYECANWDELAYDAPYYTMVISAGNDRGEGPGNGTYPDDGEADNGYDCIAGKALGKNVIAVGASGDLTTGYTGNPEDVTMTSFSSWGPADDGRVKPDITANGFYLYSPTSASDSDYGSMPGTSMSSPSVAGSLLLLQEHYEDIAGSGNFMKSATLKGLMIHTADEAGANPGPDYKFGWGLMNTEKAANVISKMNNASFILEETLNDGDTYTLLVYSDGENPLKFTMCWTDPKGTPVSAQLDPTDPMLVNDLDISVESPSGSVFQPWFLDPANPSAAASTGNNIVDNVEKIEIDAPESGIYEITIDHKESLQNNEQDFSLIISSIVANSPGNFQASPLSNTSVHLSWDQNVDGDDVMIVSSTEEFAGNPVQGQTYSVGDSINNGEVVYVGSEISFDHQNLQSGTLYYYTAWSVDESNTYSAPVETSAKTEYDIIFSDDFESDKGWSLIDEFQRDNPNGLGGEDEGNPDPSSAFQGSNVLGTDLTGLGGTGGNPEGDYAGGLGDRAYKATSPVINCNNYTEVKLNFKRWLNVEDPEFDSVQIDVSTDGGSTWDNVWYNDKSYTDNSWNDHTVDISAYADNSDQVKVRYTVGETDFGGFYSGWNIDMFKLTGKIPRYDITFHVTDGANNAIEDAYIEFIEGEGFTDASGYFTFTGIKKSSGLPYTVRKNGYNNISGTYDALQNDTLEITMNPGTATYEVEFIVMDGSALVNGATVDFNSQTETTNSEGVATFGAVEAGTSLPYTVTKDSHTETGVIDVIDQNVKDTVLFTYEVTFTVEDENTNPIENAVVNLNGYGDSTTNVNGQVVYTSVAAEENISYVVDASGYSSNSGTITVTENTQKSVQLMTMDNSITFNVDNGQEPLENVEIIINGRTLYTNESGTAVLDTFNGTYNYTMSKSHYYEASGTVEINDQDVTENVTLDRANIVEFFVSDANGSVENARVDLGTNVYYTSSNGLVSFDTINGNYIYTISKDGYNEESGDFTIMNKDTTLNISLTEVVGIEDHDNWNLSVYPNPTNGLIYIEGKDLSGSQIVIRNIIGNQIVKKVIQKSRKTEIDLSGYSNGIYLLHIRKGDKNVIRKIVVE